MIASLRRRVTPSVALVACFALAASGCTTVAQVTTPSEPACRRTLEDALARIFESQGERADLARQLAEGTSANLRSHPVGPRPFVVESPSGADYGLFVEKDKASCLLRLYGRQKGVVSYTNNLTYIATEPLAPCECAE